MIHLEFHELTHLKLESEARKAGKNLFFTTTARTQQAALSAMGNDIRRWEKAGLSEQRALVATKSVISGLCGFLFNCPLDMVIERQLHDDFPLLRPSQYLSISKLANEAIEANRKEQVRKYTPRRLLNSSLALNGAYALFLDDLFNQATEFAAAYRSEETFGLAQKLWQHWRGRSKNLGPGDEYSLVDDFADMIGIRDWYEWIPDPGHHEIIGDPLKEGTSNPGLLKAKHQSAVYYFLDAFKVYDSLTPLQVRGVAFEAAQAGQNGLDYASPEEKYELRTLPGRKFTGLHLMCLMYAGFKRFAPEEDLGMDLNEPFLSALQIYKPNAE